MSSRRAGKKTIVTVALLLAAFNPATAATIIYVNTAATGANNGTGWANAYRELVPALAQAAAGDQIWVAAGTYKPDYDAVSGTHTGDRAASFSLKGGVAIYGGFAGGETQLEDRNWQTHVAVLSGDLLGDDSGGGQSDNSYHVMVLNSGSSPPTLDGMVITGGYADEPITYGWQGGGILITVAGAAFRNCTWRGNFAKLQGGAVYSNTSALLDIQACLFEENTVDSGDTSTTLGGAIRSYHGQLRISGCAFHRNVSTSVRQSSSIGGGGAVAAYLTSVVISDSTFVENYSNGAGGALGITGPAGMEVVRCVFERNVGEVQGGAVRTGGNSFVIRDCVFRDNSTSGPEADGGGAILNEWYSLTVSNCEFIGNSSNKGGAFRTYFDNIQIVNCRFRNNSATMWGGGVYNRGSNETMVNCVVADNQSEGSGGGVDNSDSTLTMVNCTIARNTASLAGGVDAFEQSASKTITITNSILWGNSDQYGTGENSQVHISGGVLAVNHSCLQGWTGSLGGTGNIGNDPLFVVDDPWRHLQATSPCIDAADSTLLVSDFADIDGDGDTSEPTPLDFDGHPRRVDDPYVIDTGPGGAPVVDMGAHEYAEDCDANGLFDVCDLSCSAAAGACNMAGCGTSADCDNDSIPDQCEMDSEGDGTIDDCDPDDDNDGVLDDGDGSGTIGDHLCANGQTFGCDDNCRTTANPGQSNSDADSLGDACDACPDTVPGAAVDASGCPPLIPSDFNRDGDVDQTDFGHLQACLTGSAVPQTATECDDAHLDADEDVDHVDMSTLLTCLSGTDVPADPDCAE